MKAEFAHLARFIEIKNKKKIRMLKTGQFASRHRGRGSDFRDIRKYDPGDDTRFIDWNVTSRMNELYVREFYQEQELNVNVFLDASVSMRLTGLLKNEKYWYGFQFAWLLALVFSGVSDRFRLFLYSDQILYNSGILKTKASVYSTMKTVYEFPAVKSRTDHLLPLKILRESYPKRSMVYIISDFAGLPDLNLFKQLHQQHEISAVRILDGSEKIPKSFLKQFSIYTPGSSGGGGDYNPSMERDRDRLKQFFRNKILDLFPDEKGTSAIMEFFK